MTQVNPAAASGGGLPVLTGRENLLAQSNNPINGGKASDIGQHDVQGYGPDGKTVLKAQITQRIYNDGSNATRFYANGKALPANIQTLEAAKVFVRQQIKKGGLGDLPRGDQAAFAKTSTRQQSTPTRLETLPAGSGKVVAKVNGNTLVTELKARSGYRDGQWQPAGFVADGITEYVDRPVGIEPIGGYTQKPEAYGYFRQSIGKQRLITDTSGAVITDLEKARARTAEMMNKGGLTMKTDAFEQQHQRNKIANAPGPAVQGATVKQWQPAIPLPKPIAQMSMSDRLNYMKDVAWSRAGESGRKELENMTSWQSLLMMGAFAGAQAIPGVDLIADGIAILMLGKDVVDTGGKLAASIKAGLTAQQPYELEQAGQQMGEALTHIAATAGTAAAGVGVKKVAKTYRETASTRALESTMRDYKAGNATPEQLRRAIIVASQDKAALAKAKAPKTQGSDTTQASSQTPKTNTGANTGSQSPAVTGEPNPAGGANPAGRAASAAAQRNAEVAKAQSYLDNITTPQVRAAVAEGANKVWKEGGKVDTATLNALKKAAETQFVNQTVPAVADAVFADPSLRAKLTAQLSKNAAGSSNKAQALASSPQAVQKLAQALVLPELEQAAFGGSKVPKAARNEFTKMAQAWARQQQPSNPAGALEVLKGKPQWQATMINEVLIDQITGTSASSVKTLAKTDPAAAQVQNTFRQRIAAEVQQNHPSVSGQKDLLAQAGGQARTDLVRRQVAAQLGGDSPMATALAQQLKAKGVGERDMVKLVNSPAAQTTAMKTALIEQVRSSSNPTQKLTPTQQVSLRKAIEKKLATLPNEAAKHQYLKDLANSGKTIAEMSKGQGTVPAATPGRPTAGQNPTAPTGATEPVQTMPRPSDVAGSGGASKPGAIVLASQAAVSFDIPPIPGKGQTRVGAVYGKVVGTQANGISDSLANVLGKTLQDINPGSYGKRTLKDVVDNNVRGDADTSLTVVVRDKNIQGQSPASDSVATRSNQAALDDAVYRKFDDILPNKTTLANAVERIGLGSAKIYEAPPARDAIHVEALRSSAPRDASGFPLGQQRGGEGYGYVGQVVAAKSLKGGGYAAMVEVQNLARAANMKGLTLYTNNEAGFYSSKLGFKTVAETTKNGVTSSHMVWENPNYVPNQPTLKLNNPAVTNAMKNPPESWGRQQPSGTPPNPSGGQPNTGTNTGTNTATVGTPATYGGSNVGTGPNAGISSTVNGLQTRVLIDAAKTKLTRTKEAAYEAVSIAYEDKFEGPMLDFAGKLGSGINNRVVLPSARALNDKILTPVMDSAAGQKLTSIVNAGATQFKEAAFQAKLNYVYHSNSTLGLVLRDMATIAKNAGSTAATGSFKALGTAGKNLQKTLPAVAASTAVILTNAAATGKLRVVTVEAGIKPTGEALMVKKALNIPNGLKYTYLIADAPGMESVGGRAIFAYGGGDSAVITPATGPGQSGVSQPWIGKRADGSIVTTATGAAYGPNGFAGYSLGSTNFNISDVYAGQLGRVSTNPASVSGGGTRASGRSGEIRLGVIAADLASFNHSSVLNVGPGALTFNRYRDPLSIKGTLGSTENKYLVLLPKTKPNGQTYYTPFLDATAKGGVSQIEPVVPLTGSTTFDPNAKDMAALGQLLNSVGSLLPKSPAGDTPAAPQQPSQPYIAPKRKTDYTEPTSAVPDKKKMMWTGAAALWCGPRRQRRLPVCSSSCAAPMCKRPWPSPTRPAQSTRKTKPFKKCRLKVCQLWQQGSRWWARQGADPTPSRRP